MRTWEHGRRHTTRQTGRPTDGQPSVIPRIPSPSPQPSSPIRRQRARNRPEHARPPTFQQHAGHAAVCALACVSPAGRALPCMGAESHALAARSLIFSRLATARGHSTKPNRRAGVRCGPTRPRALAPALLPPSPLLHGTGQRPETRALRVARRPSSKPTLLHPQTSRRTRSTHSLLLLCDTDPDADPRAW